MRTWTSGVMLVLILTAASARAATLELVNQRTSDYVIYFEQGAPPSVTMAASELRKYVRDVSGVTLPIVKRPRQPMICLGNNAAMRAARLPKKDIPLEGYRIATKGPNIFIFGPDTARGETTSGGGTSTGTRNGVYAWIEQFLGVRWLVPGEHGDFVPKSSQITVPAIDRISEPGFLNRRVPYIQERRADTKLWSARQRLGWSLYLNHGHNWRRSIPAFHFADHPDWFAERGGVRVPPTGRYKLCITNPGLIRAYANAIIRYFEQNPAATCYSLSPSDSAGFCECPRCSAQYETDPHGNRSITPAILTFYNAVAKLVAVKFPKKTLAGYVYSCYVYPPKTPIRLAPNVFLVWAPSFDYGYTLFRPNLQHEWEGLLKQWTQVTDNLSYYDLPSNIETQTGALNPPGLKILKFIYPRLKAAKVKGVYVYGTDAWGRAGPRNFILARLAWDPNADIDALFDDYCAKAYGEAGAEINRMFRLLDSETERYYIEHSDARYTLTSDMKRNLYAKNWPLIERLYRTAESKVENADAKARLKTIGDNLTVFHWYLRHAKMLDHAPKSGFYLSDADFFRFLQRNRNSIALEPTTATRRPPYIGKKLTVAPASPPANAMPTKVFRLRGDQHLVLCPSGKQPVQVTFRLISNRGQMVTYRVYRADGKELAAGMINAEEPIRLSGNDSPYYHVGISAGSASFMVDVAGAQWAVDGRLTDQGMHLLGKVTPIYFHVPAEARSFHLSLEATPPGETALATLVTPSGITGAEFDCTRVSVDRQKITVAAGDSGWWRLDIKRASVGVIDDVWIKLGNELSGYFSLVPKQALEVTPVK